MDTHAHGAWSLVSRWLAARRLGWGWRLALTALSGCWWLFLATFFVADPPSHPYWWIHVEDILDACRAAPRTLAVLSGLLAVAVLWPWALPTVDFKPPPGWRSWIAGGALACALPQLGHAAVWFANVAPLEPAATVAGQPDRPVLWIVASSADVGVHLPRLDTRPHDYFSVRDTAGVLPGVAAGVWAQVCGRQLHGRWSGTGSHCLVDRDWRVLLGQPGRGLARLLASTGAAVTGAGEFPRLSPGRADHRDAELLRTALALDKLRPHVLVLTAEPQDRDDVLASDAAIDAVVGEWLDRGGIALVTADRPRGWAGWRALPVRLYGVDRLALPVRRNKALEFGKSSPGRLMGGLPNGSLYDAGCTAWALTAFGCRRLGHGISLTHDRSRTLGAFRAPSA